ncbi:unnamed protein product [Effrenium voratum]|nr:unnamed protein product [Effrenium voratum]
MTTQAQVLAQYYAREGYYNKAQTLCNEEARRTNDIPLHLWKAYALHCEGSTREAIFEAEACLGKRDMGLPFASALAFFHNQLGTVDQDAVRDMNVRASQELHHAPEAAKLLTVRFYTMVGETEKGQEVLGSMDDIDSAAANAVRGWNAFVAGKKVNAASGKTSNAFLEQCGQFFDAATGSGTELENLDALMGKAKVLEGKRQWAQALDCLNKVIVMHDWFLPALMEKAKTLMMTADWDQALEAAGRLQQQEPNNIEALRLNVLFLLSRESRCDAAAERLQELVAAMQQLEPHNYDLVSNASLPESSTGLACEIRDCRLRKALDAAARRAKEARHLAQTCEAQATLIAELKARSQNTVQPAELMLVHCREQTLHDILHEKCEQLDLRVGRSRAEPEVPPLEAARLAKAVFQRTQQAMELLAEIELHSRRTQSEDVAPSTATRDRKSAAKIPRAARASKSAPARADLLEDAMQAMTAAQLRCEEAERQCSVAEEQLLHKQSGTWGQELGRLQRELQQKTARLSQLQRFMGVH